MSIFKFRLQCLLRLRESQRDEARLLLADLLRQDALLIDDQAALDGAVATARTELGTTSVLGPVDLARHRDLQSFETGLRQRRRSIDTARRALEPQIAERRQALAAAQRELRLLEQLAEREAAEHRTAMERAAQRELDELFAARMRSEPGPLSDTAASRFDERV
jgi:flagellar export protein FliJ